MLADRAYRRWLQCSLAFALVAGAGGGTWLTLTIARAGGVLAIADMRGFILATNAAAHALIVGWMGVFLAACADRVLPGAADRPPSQRVPAWLALGAAAHAISEAALAAGMLAAPTAVAAMRAGSAVELAAALLLAIRLSRAGAPAAIGGWFFAIAVGYDAWYAPLPALAADAGELLRVVSTWQAALRDLQVHGAALCLLLALAETALQPATPVRRWTLALIAAGTLGEAITFLEYRLSGNHAFAAATLLPWTGIAVAAGAATARWRWWRPGGGDTATLACRSACAWLMVSFAMHLLFRPYHLLLGRPFSHAWFAAMGQAAALGFVAQMVMALIAATSPVATIGLRRTTIAYNLALAAMLAALIGTDWHPAAAYALGAAGIAEGLALAWWCLRAAAALR